MSPVSPALRPLPRHTGICGPGGADLFGTAGTTGTSGQPGGVINPVIDIA